MKKVFVDTNILIDLLADRRPFSKYAIILFSKAESKQVKLYTSSHAFATTHYLLKKYVEEKELREILHSLLDYLNIIAIDTEIIKKALKSKHKDFEDAVQMISAGSVEKLDYIVTRNLKDFKNSGIMAISPDELIKHL
jgi:predicted nucleic acid-binding protein